MLELDQSFSGGFLSFHDSIIDIFNVFWPESVTLLAINRQNWISFVINWKIIFEDFESGVEVAEYISQPDIDFLSLVDCVQPKISGSVF